MKKRQLALALILCILLSIVCSACGDKGKNEDDSKIGFTEQEITLPDEVNMVFDIKKIDEKTVRMIGFNEDWTKGTVWESQDKGESWSKITEFTKNIKIKKTKTTTPETAGYLSPSGEVFCVVTDWKEDGENVTFSEKSYLVKNDEVKELKINLPKAGEEQNAIYSADYTDNDLLLIQDNLGQIYKVDKNTGKIQLSFLPDNVVDISNPSTIYKDNLYVLTAKGLKTYSIETGKENEVDKSIRNFTKYKEEQDAPRSKFTVTSTKDDKLQLFSINNDGLSKFIDGENEILLEGSKTCLSSARTSLYKFIHYDDENLFLIAHTTNGSKLYRYSYSDKERTNETLTIYSLKENEDIDEMIGLFQRKNPETEIQLEIGMNDENGITETEALKILNTKILSGEGPDIIYLDNISAETFTDNGLLLDVNDVLNSLPNKSSILNNIVKSYTNKDKVYTVPTKFSFISMESSAEAVKQVGDMDSLIKQMKKLHENTDKPVIDDEYFETITTLLYRIYLSPNIKKDISISEEKLTNFYQNIKELYSLCDPNSVLNAESYRDIGMYPYAGTELLKVTAKQIQLSINYILDTRDIKCLQKLETDKQAYKILGENNAFVPINMIGINSKSNKTDLAKTFLAFTLSPEGQANLPEEGMPVDVNVLEKRLSEKSDSAGFGDTMIELKNLSKEDINSVIKIFKSFKTPLNSDIISADIIMEPVERMLKDEMTVDETVQSAMKKLKLYLAE